MVASGHLKGSVVAFEFWGVFRALVVFVAVASFSLI